MSWKSVACVGSATRMPWVPLMEMYSIARLRNFPRAGTLTEMRKRVVAVGLIDVFVETVNGIEVSEEGAVLASVDELV